MMDDFICWPKPYLLYWLLYSYSTSTLRTSCLLESLFYSLRLSLVPTKTYTTKLVNDLHLSFVQHTCRLFLDVHKEEVSEREREGKKEKTKLVLIVALSLFLSGFIFSRWLHVHSSYPSISSSSTVFLVKIKSVDVGCLTLSVGKLGLGFLGLGL